jgi:2-polyprenyl-6-methoxyphenol hydroxylase-like FAD-dependent oxidoreductase
MPPFDLHFEGTAAMRTSAEVLIVGAGPVGLLLATELLRERIDVLLIERLAERSFFCKALGVTPRTLEIFDDLGIVQDAIDAGIWLRGVSSFDAGVPGAAMDLPVDLPFGSLSLAQFDTERLLEGCLLQHGGRVVYGRTLSGFVQDQDGVRAEVAGPGGETETISCRWLVGCDGAHSKVRATLGLDFAGSQYPQTFMLADLEVGWDLPRGRAYRFNQGAPGETGRGGLVAIPVRSAGGCRYRLSTVLPESASSPPSSGEETRNPPSLDQVVTVMSPMLPQGTRLSSLHWSSVYRVSHRIVPSYAKGRAFLAGDAAHLHPPVGGQGMNTGLQDAHNLAWKLALASRNQASQELMDSYSAERHPVGLDVVENTSRALNDVLAQRAALPGMRETQLLINYRYSPIVKDGRAGAASTALAAGDRIPDVGQLRRAFVRQSFRLHERLGRGRHVLFGFIDEDPALVDQLTRMLDLLHAVLGRAAAGFAVAAHDRLIHEREDLPIFTDAGGEFANSFAARPGMAWLARPDGYIGWYSDAFSLSAFRSGLELIARVPALDLRGGGEAH